MDYCSHIVERYNRNFPLQTYYSKECGAKTKYSITYNKNWNSRNSEVEMITKYLCKTHLNWYIRLFDRCKVPYESSKL